MKKEILERIILGCETKINKKDVDIGLSFYAFFENKNKEPETLLEVAQWWIMTHKLDHFEKAVDIKKIALEELRS